MSESAETLASPFGSPVWTKVDPAIPGVYRVALFDNGRRHEEIANCDIHAYWDGVDTWSNWTTMGVRDARRQNMLKPNMKPYEWIGEAL